MVRGELDTELSVQAEATDAIREAEERFRTALEASEERFRSAFDGILDTLGIFRSMRDEAGAIVDFEIVYVNRAWQDVYGRPGVDPVGRRLYADYPFFAPRRDMHVATVETGEPFRQTLEIDGTPSRWYEFLVTKYGDGYVAASRDVTDRYLAEGALKASEERLADIVGGIDAIVTLEDETTGESYVSPQAERILGFPAERLADLEFWKSRVHPEDAPRIFPTWDEEMGEYELEYRMRASDERVVWLRERVVHQIDPSRGLNRWFGVAVDVTERRMLEDQLDRARRMESLGRLASGVAHDFNNVLYGISILTDFLLQELPEGAWRDDARQIREAVDRGVGLTRQLLGFARGGSGAAEPTNVASVVAGVASMLELLLGGAISIETEASPTAAIVVLDRHGLEQALVNLATNARDAMPGGGRLRMATQTVELDDVAAVAAGVEPGAYVRITVADTGSGVPPEIAPRIFEPFATTKPVETGSGLGLSNVYSFVRGAGGGISFESVPGEGTTFAIYLPIAG